MSSKGKKAAEPSKPKPAARPRNLNDRKGLYMRNAERTMDSGDPVWLERLVKENRVQDRFEDMASGLSNTSLTNESPAEERTDDDTMDPLLVQTTAVRLGTPQVYPDSVPQVVTRTQTRQVEVPVTRQVKVPVRTQRVVPTEYTASVETTKYYPVTTTEQVHEVYTKYTPDPHTSQMVPQHTTRVVSVPTTVYRPVVETRQVRVPGEEVVDTDGYRIDTVEDTKLVTVEEKQDYEIIARAVGAPTVTRAVDSHTYGARLSRTPGHVLLYSDDPRLGSIEDDTSPTGAYTSGSRPVSASQQRTSVLPSPGPVSLSLSQNPLSRSFSSTTGARPLSAAATYRPLSASLTRPLSRPLTASLSRPRAAFGEAPAQEEPGVGGGFVSPATGRFNETADTGAYQYSPPAVQYVPQVSAPVRPWTATPQHHRKFPKAPIYHLGPNGSLHGPEPKRYPPPLRASDLWLQQRQHPEPQEAFVTYVPDISSRPLGVGVLESGDGVFVREVDNNSAAARGGLRVGDIIHYINKRHVRSVDQFQSAISAAMGPYLKLWVSRVGVRRNLNLTILR